MKSELLKYKHYLILLSALLLANYIIVPLSGWQTTQQETLVLLENKYNKTQMLLDSGESFDLKSASLDKKLGLIGQVLFKSKDEATFKQIAQSTIENLLTKAECKIERIGFKGSTVLNNNIEKWSLEIRYKGDAICLLKTTRAIESMQPYVRIESYNAVHNGLKKDAAGNFNASLNVSVWYMEKSV